MSLTLNNISLQTNSWVDLYGQSGIEVGRRVSIRNVGNSDVYISVSDTQPLNNDAYIVIKPRDNPIITNIGDPGLWGFSPVKNGLINVSEYFPAEPPLSTSAFGNLMTSEETPLIQITAQYGLLGDVLSASIGGSTTTVDSKFKCSTGTGANNVSAIISSREAQYKAGQGLACKITAIFTAGVANSTQQAGFLTSESAFCFGYDGVDFGILHSRDGELENQELTITNSASGSENATIFIDGVSYSVPLTSGTVQKNAYEISSYLNSNAPGYRFTSNDDTVYALAQLPDFGGGAFSFSSATAVAAWVQIKAGALPIETWIKKSDWNVRPNIDINPIKGNVYKIQIQYLGFGGICFFVENPKTAQFEIVHIIQYANTETVPSVSNPIFRVGWAARNTGNTSDISVQGGSAAAFVEGKVKFDGRPNGFCQEQESVSTTRVNVLGFRNRMTFNGTANRAEIIPKLLSLATDTTKIAVFEIIQDPVPAAGEFLEWQYVNESLSLMEATTTNAEVVGGSPVACFNVTAGGIPPINMSEILEFQSPVAEFSITARVVGTGTGATMSASGTWKEDL